jgi:hypothetical protein
VGVGATTPSHDPSPRMKSSETVLNSLTILSRGFLDVLHLMAGALHVAACPTMPFQASSLCQTNGH